MQLRSPRPNIMVLGSPDTVWHTGDLGGYTPRVCSGQGIVLRLVQLCVRLKQTLRSNKFAVPLLRQFIVTPYHSVYIWPLPGNGCHTTRTHNLFKPIKDARRVRRCGSAGVGHLGIKYSRCRRAADHGFRDNLSFICLHSARLSFFFFQLDSEARMHTYSIYYHSVSWQGSTWARR